MTSEEILTDLTDAELLALLEEQADRAHAAHNDDLHGRFRAAAAALRGGEISVTETRAETGSLADPTDVDPAAVAAILKERAERTMGIGGYGRHYRLKAAAEALTASALDEAGRSPALG